MELLTKDEEKKRERNRIARKYAKSEKGIQKRKEYLESEKGKAYLARRAEKSKAKMAEFRNTEEGRKRVTELHLKRTYGMELKTFEDFYEQQEGKCKICLKVPEETLHVDHCHETGKVRGLLCKKCNSGLGMFSDNIELLKRAVEYLGEE